MQLSTLIKYAAVSVCSMTAALLFQGNAFAERSIVQVTPGEYRRLGYMDKDEFAASYNTCVQIAKDLKKRNVCTDDSCVKSSEAWKSNGCEKHATTMHYLTSIDPARYPVSELFDNSERANYVRLYTASCQDGYKATNPGGDVSLVKNTCECAANQSLDLIEYSDYKAFESTKASKEVIDRVKSRAAYARFICENKPAVWREQSADIGSSAADRKGAGSTLLVDRANLNDGRLLGLLDQLQTQGTALYNSLLAKLNAEAADKSCRNDMLCNRANEMFGAIYKDVLYVAYATQIYRSSDENTRPQAGVRLNEFVKVAMLSVEPNVRFIRSYAADNQSAKTDKTLLMRTLRDAEECQKLMLTISSELARR